MSMEGDLVGNLGADLLAGQLLVKSAESISLVVTIALVILALIVNRDRVTARRRGGVWAWMRGSARERRGMGEAYDFLVECLVLLHAELLLAHGERWRKQIGLVLPCLRRMGRTVKGLLAQSYLYRHNHPSGQLVLLRCS